MEDLPHELVAATPSGPVDADWARALASWADRHAMTGKKPLLDEALPEFERVLIRSALKRTQGHRQEAAKLLGWGRNTLTRKLKELGMNDVDHGMTSRNRAGRVVIARPFPASRAPMMNFSELWNHTVSCGTPPASGFSHSCSSASRSPCCRCIKGYISNRRRKWAEGDLEVPTAIEVITLLVARTSKLFLFTLAVALALTQLEFPKRIDRYWQIVIVLTFWFQIGLWGMAMVRFAIDKRARKGNGLDPALASSIDIIVFIAGLTIWAMAFLLALDNLGIEIKPLLAGLGIGGIAVALAVQTVLSDLLASMSIALDKPFAVGDALQVDDLNGTVEHIGVKSTRLRSLLWRADHHLERGYPEITGAEQRSHARSARFVLHQCGLRHTVGEAEADPGHRAGHRDEAAEDALRSLSPAVAHRLGPALRDGVLHDRLGLQRVRGCAAGHQYRDRRRAEEAGRGYCLPLRAATEARRRRA